jgi:hypothetical protein
MRRLVPRAQRPRCSSPNAGNTPETILDGGSNVRMVGAALMSHCLGKIVGRDETHIEMFDSCDLLEVLESFGVFELDNENGFIVVSFQKLRVALGPAATRHTTLPNGRKLRGLHERPGLIGAGNLWNHNAVHT